MASLKSPDATPATTPATVPALPPAITSPSTQNTVRRNRGVSFVDFASPLQPSLVLPAVRMNSVTSPQIGQGSFRNVHGRSPGSIAMSPMDTKRPSFSPFVATMPQGDPRKTSVITSPTTPRITSPTTPAPQTPAGEKNQKEKLLIAAAAAAATKHHQRKHAESALQSTYHKFYTPDSLPPWRAHLKEMLLDSLIVDRVILVVIIANSIALAVEDPSPGVSRPQSLAVLEIVFFVFYCLEFVIKVAGHRLYGNPLSYFGYRKKVFSRFGSVENSALKVNWWGVLDFMVVVAGAISLATPQSSSDSGGGPLAALKGFRLVRPLKAISKLSQMRVLIKSILQAFPKLLDIAILFVMFLAGSALIGVQLFMGALRSRCYRMADLYEYEAPHDDPTIYFGADNTPVSNTVLNMTALHRSYFDVKDNGDSARFCSNSTSFFRGYHCAWGWQCVEHAEGLFSRSFDSFPEAFLTLAVSVTREGWTGVMYNVMDTTNEFSAVFFVVVVFLGSYCFLNLTVVIVNSIFDYNVAYENEKNKLIESEESAKTAPEGNPLLPAPEPPGNALVLQRIDEIEERRRRAEEKRKSEQDMEELLEKALNGSAKVVEDNILDEVVATPKSQAKNDIEEKENPSDIPQEQLLLNLNKYQRALVNVVNSQEYEYFIMTAVICNIVALSAWHHSISDSFLNVLLWINLAVAAIFVADCAVKIIVFSPKIYFRKAWNVFDFFIALVSIAHVSMESPMYHQDLRSGEGDSTSFSVKLLQVLRSMQVFRVFKVVMQFRRLQRWARVFASSLTSVATLTGLLSMLTFIYALVGMQLFAGRLCQVDLREEGGVSSIPSWSFFAQRYQYLEVHLNSVNASDGEFYEQLQSELNYADARAQGLSVDEATRGKVGNIANECVVPRANFENVFLASLTLFQILSGEDWQYIMYNGMASRGWFSSVFFISWYFIGNSLLLNLFVSILIARVNSIKEIDTALQAIEVDWKTERKELLIQSLHSERRHELAAQKRTRRLSRRSQSRRGTSTSSVMPPNAFFPDERRRSSTGRHRKSVDLNEFSFGRAENELSSSESSSYCDTSDTDDTDDTDDTSVEDMAERGDRPFSWVEGVTSKPSFKMPIQGEQEDTDDEERNSADEGTDAFFSRPVRWRKRNNTGRRNSDRRNLLNNPPPASLASTGSALLLESNAKDDNAATASSSSGSDTSEHGRSRQPMYQKVHLFMGELYRDITYLTDDFTIAKHSETLDKVLIQIVESKVLEVLVMCAIFCSCAVLSLYSPTRAPDTKMARTLQNIDNANVAIFCTEALLKILAYGFVFGNRTYLRRDHPWNKLDFFIVVASLLSTFSPEGSSLQKLKIIKVIRVLRPLRFINKFSGLKIVIGSLWRAIPALGMVMVLGFLGWLVFAILGVQLFSGTFSACTKNQWGDMAEVYPNISSCNAANQNLRWESYQSNFDDILHAFLTLFELGTLEGWVEVMYIGMDSVSYSVSPIKDSRPLVAIYFVAFIFLGAYFVVNLFVSALVDAFQDQRKDDANLMLTDDQRVWLAFQKTLLKHVRTPISLDENTQLKGMRLMCTRLVVWKFFDPFINVCIVLNIIIIASEHYGEPDSWTWVHEALNWFFVFTFSIECFAKITAYRPKVYFSSKSNRFDFIIVTTSVIGIFLTLLKISFGGAVSIFRALRLLRLLRLVHAAKGVQNLVQTLFLTLPTMANVSGMMLLMFFCYAVLGVYLFGRVTVEGQTQLHGRATFQDFYSALLLLIRIATGEAWPVLMHEAAISEPHCSAQLDSCGDQVAAYFYFVTFVVLETYIILNVFIAVLLDSFNDVITSECMDDGINEKELDRFFVLWKRFDPLQRCTIELKEIPKFLRELGPPLGPERSLSSDKTIFKRYLSNIKLSEIEGDSIAQFGFLTHLYLTSYELSTGLIVPNAVKRKFRKKIKVIFSEMKEAKDRDTAAIAPPPVESSPKTAMTRLRSFSQAIRRRAASEVYVDVEGKDGKRIVKRKKAPESESTGTDDSSDHSDYKALRCNPFLLAHTVTMVQAVWRGKLARIRLEKKNRSEEANKKFYVRAPPQRKGSIIPDTTPNTKPLPNTTSRWRARDRGHQPTGSAQSTPLQVPLGVQEQAQPTQRFPALSPLTKSLGLSWREEGGPGGGGERFTLSPPRRPRRAPRMAPASPLTSDAPSSTSFRPSPLAEWDLGGNVPMRGFGIGGESSRLEENRSGKLGDSVSLDDIV